MDRREKLKKRLAVNISKVSLLIVDHMEGKSFPWGLHEIKIPKQCKDEYK